MGRKLIAFLAFALFCVLVSAGSSSDYDAKNKDVVKGKYKSSDKKPSYYDGDKYDKNDDDKYDDDKYDDDKYDDDKYDDDKYDDDKYDDDKYDDDKYDDDKYDKDDEDKYDDDDEYKKDDKKNDGKYNKKDDKKNDGKLLSTVRTQQKYNKKDKVYKYEKKEKKKYYSAKKCMFKFCHGKAVVVIGKKNDRALTSAICSKKYGVKIGSVDQTGEALLKNNYRDPISKWIPVGLKQEYSPSFFKAYTKYGKNRSGVGHEVPQQKQAKFLHRKCWILPIKAYQVWNKKTGGWVEKYGKDPYVDCISFCTVVPKKYHKY